MLDAPLTEPYVRLFLIRLLTRGLQEIWVILPVLSVFHLHKQKFSNLLRGYKNSSRFYGVHPQFFLFCYLYRCFVILHKIILLSHCLSLPFMVSFLCYLLVLMKSMLVSDKIANFSTNSIFKVPSGFSRTLATISLTLSGSDHSYSFHSYQRISLLYTMSIMPSLSHNCDV